jgi:hypothetical protein
MRPPASHLMALTGRDVQRYRAAQVACHRIRTKRQCLAFVNRFGFCYAFTPGPGGLPGLFDVVGTRSVDRMWSWAWQWKDELATEKKLFYGKVLHRKPTYIALRYLPHFYALSGNVGEPDDYLQAYSEGRLSRLARDIYEYLRDHGASSTWALRRQFVPRGSSGSAFHRALVDLQGRLLITKVAESETGSYSFIWDTFHRFMPQAVRDAAGITGAQAAGAVLERYLQTAGAATDRLISAVFAWPADLVQEARAARDGTVLTMPVDAVESLVHADLVSWRTRRR